MSSRPWSAADGGSSTIGWVPTSSFSCGESERNPRLVGGVAGGWFNTQPCSAIGNVGSGCPIIWGGSACATCRHDSAGCAMRSTSDILAGKSCPCPAAQEPSCSSTNILNLGRTASMRECGRPFSSGSRDTISADVAVAHEKGCVVGIVTPDDPPYVVGSVVSPRDNTALVALVALCGFNALCVRSPEDDGVCAGPRGPMSLALDFPARGARRARTLTCEGWSRVVIGDCVIGSATSTPRE